MTKTCPAGLIKTGCSIQGHMTLCLPQISKFKGSQKLALPPRLIDEIWTCKIVIGPRNCNSQIVKCQIHFPPKIGSSNLVPSDHKKIAESQEWVLCWSYEGKCQPIYKSCQRSWREPYLVWHSLKQKEYQEFRNFNHITIAINNSIKIEKNNNVIN